MRSENCLDIRAHPVSQRWDQLRRIRPQIVLAPTNQTIARSEREEHLGRGGIERNDSLRWRSDLDSITEIVGGNTRPLLRISAGNQRQCERWAQPSFE